jgi:hypothetical protein
MSDNWNYLAQQARGRFILIMGDDDMLLKKTLSRLRQYILEYPVHDLFAFGFNVIDENNLLVYTRKSPKLFEISCESDKILSELLAFSVIPFWTFHQFTICYKRGISQNIKYNRDAHTGSDFLFLIECMNTGKKMLIIPEVLFSWRKLQKEDNRGGINLSRDGINNIKSRNNIMKILHNRNDFHLKIQRIVFNKQFEKRFLLDSLILDNSNGKQEIIKTFQHDKQFFDALMELKMNPLTRFKVRIIQFNNYLGIFGFAGFFHILWYVWQRGYNRIRARTIR